MNQYHHFLNKKLTSTSIVYRISVDRYTIGIDLNFLITGSWLRGFLLPCQATRWPKTLLWHWSQSTTTYPQIYWGCWLSGSADTNSYQSIAPGGGQLHAFQIKTIPASLTKNDSKVICQLIFGIKQQCHKNNFLDLSSLVKTCRDLSRLETDLYTTTISSQSTSQFKTQLTKCQSTN